MPRPLQNQRYGCPLETEPRYPIWRYRASSSEVTGGGWKPSPSCLGGWSRSAERAVAQCAATQGLVVIARSARLPLQPSRRLCGDGAPRETEIRCSVPFDFLFLS